MKQINLLNEYFNSISDASNLEALEQEKLEKDFEEWLEEKSKDFDFVSRIMIKHMAENYHPHNYCLVDATHCEVLESQKALKTNAYLVD